MFSVIPVHWPTSSLLDGIQYVRSVPEQVLDVYGREVVQKYEKLRKFYNAFRGRESAMRDEKGGEVASKEDLERMQTCAKGVWYMSRFDDRYLLKAPELRILTILQSSSYKISSRLK